MPREFPKRDAGCPLEGIGRWIRQSLVLIYRTLFLCLLHLGCMIYLLFLREAIHIGKREGVANLWHRRDWVLVKMVPSMTIWKVSFKRAFETHDIHFGPFICVKPQCVFNFYWFFKPKLTQFETRRSVFVWIPGSNPGAKSRSEFTSGHLAKHFCSSPVLSSLWLQKKQTCLCWSMAMQKNEVPVLEGQIQHALGVVHLALPMIFFTPDCQALPTFPVLHALSK